MSNGERRDPIQRRIFAQIMKLVERLKIPARLAVVKNIFAGINKKADEEKKDDQ